MKKEQLILLVSNPNQSFVRTEIEMFAKLVEKLFVISNTHEQASYLLPTNVVFQNIKSSEYKSERISIALFLVFLIDFCSHITNIRYLKKWRQHFSFLRQADCLKKQLISTINKQEIGNGTPVLSFWCDIWAVALALLKKGNIGFNVYSRLHGRDLYEERQPTTIFAIPFRPFVLSQLNGVFPISQHGGDYLKQKYIQYKHKVKTNYLGCSNFKVCEKPSHVFTVLSIATIRHVKRIDRIAEVVRDYPNEIHWIHIGGEANRNNDPTIAYTDEVIKEIKLEKSKQVTMTGAIDVGEIETIVNRYNPHVLVNTSEYEGLPVSVMEALSMGIPCIATDVGGTKELINEKTGLLLSAEFTNEELTNGLQQVHDKWISNSVDYRKTNKLQWEQLLNPLKNRETLLSWM
jgi:colanic acid/amylovoran biosynthesis glycosyltransferase